MSAERGQPETPSQDRRIEQEIQLDTDLKRYILSFGIDPVHDLIPQDVTVFAAARKLEKYIENMKIPVAKKRVEQQKMVAVEETIEREIPRTTYLEGEDPSEVPADSLDVAQMSDLRQLPGIMSGQWLEEEINPDRFLEKAVTGQLLRRQWLRKTRTPVTSYETIEETILVEKPAPPEDEKRHAYVLLDVSGSMAEYGKEIAAKGLTLAFLRRGFLERSQLYVRPFTDILYDLKRGKTDEEFKKMTLSILHEEVADGGTNIQYALERAVKDITEGGEFAHADILLITDGEDRLYYNPLGSINLHTLILNHRYEEPPEPNLTDKLAKKVLTRAEKSKKTHKTSIRGEELEEWSKTYKIINPREFQNMDSREKKKLELEIVRSFPDRFPHETLEDLEKLLKESDNVQSLYHSLDVFSYNNSLNDEENDEVVRILSKLAKLRDPWDIKALIANKQIEQLAQQEAAERAAREKEEVEQQIAEEALGDLQELVGDKPKIEIPLPKTQKKPQRISDSDIEGMLPEDMLDALQEFTGHSPANDLADTQQTQSQQKQYSYPQSGPTSQPQATRDTGIASEQALQTLQKFTGKVPDVQIPQEHDQTMPPSPVSDTTLNMTEEEAMRQLQGLTDKTSTFDHTTREQEKNLLRRIVDAWRQRRSQ